MSDVANLLAQLAARADPAADPAMAVVRLARASIDALVLKLGQTIEAKVTGQLAGGFTQLTAGDDSFVLKLTTPLPAGAAVTLKVRPSPGGQPAITVALQQPQSSAASPPPLSPASSPLLPNPPTPQPQNAPAPTSPVVVASSQPSQTTPPPPAATPLSAATTAPSQPATPAQSTIAQLPSTAAAPTVAPPQQPPPQPALPPTSSALPSAAATPTPPTQPLPQAQAVTVPAASSLPPSPAPSPQPVATQPAPQPTQPAPATPISPSVSQPPVVPPQLPGSAPPTQAAAAAVPSTPTASAATTPPPPPLSAQPAQSAVPPPPSTPQPTATPSSPPLAQVLADPAQAAARQDSIAPLIAKLAALIASPAAATIPRPMLEAMVRVLAGRIDLDRSPPDGRAIRDAVLSAGVAIERGRSQPADARSTLLTLRNALSGALGADIAPVAPVTRRPAPPLKGEPARAPQSLAPTLLADEPLETARQLLGHTDAALSRLKLLQLASGAPDSRPGPSIPPAGPEFRVEIPLQLGAETGILQLLVQRDGKHKSAPRERNWRMRFALNFTATGEVGADVALLGRAANVSLWAAEPSTADALEAMLPELVRALARHGLDVATLRVRRGVPPRPVPSPGQLLDSAR